MTPKDKAKDLLLFHLHAIPDYLIQDNEEATELARVHAVLTVDLIIDEVIDLQEKNEGVYGIIELFERHIYWEEVKQELEKL